MRIKKPRNLASKLVIPSTALFVSVKKTQSPNPFRSFKSTASPTGNINIIIRNFNTCAGPTKPLLNGNFAGITSCPSASSSSHHPICLERLAPRRLQPIQRVRSEDLTLNRGSGPPAAGQPLLSTTRRRQSSSAPRATS